MNNKIKIFIDNSLKDVPEDIKIVKTEILNLQEKLKKKININERLSILSSLGVYNRLLLNLDYAISYFERCLEIIELYNLSKIKKTIVQIRKAHCHQWKKEFDVSNLMFNLLLTDCANDEELNNYIDFVFQHRGKNFFDQEMFTEAMFDFNSALLIRNKKVIKNYVTAL